MTDDTYRDDDDDEKEEKKEKKDEKKKNVAFKATSSSKGKAKQDCRTRFSKEYQVLTICVPRMST